MSCKRTCRPALDWSFNRVDAIRADVFKETRKALVLRQCTVQFSTCEDVIYKRDVVFFFLQCYGGWLCFGIKFSLLTPRKKLSLTKTFLLCCIISYLNSVTTIPLEVWFSAGVAVLSRGHWLCLETVYSSQRGWAGGVGWMLLAPGR